MRAAGIEPVTPTKEMTPLGLVESFDDARKAAELFRREQVCGIVIGAVNFGNEVPAATAAIEGAAGNPIFLFGCVEDGKLTYTGERRDALCGALSIATAMRQREVKYTFPRNANCRPDDPALINELRDFAAVCRAVSGVRGAVYGQIGPRPLEFETCAFDELSLLRKLGIRTVPVPLSHLFERARTYGDDAKIRRIIKSISKFFDVDGVPQASMERLARLEIILTELIAQHGMDGMALQCWSSMQEDFGVASCAVMARLNELRGIPVACEVDIHGTLSMHLLALATDTVPALMDWNNRHYKEKNVFSAWHCGVYPNAMCEGVCKLRANQILKKNYEKQPDKIFGVLDGAVKPGPVTMTRVTESVDGTWKMLIAEGESVKVPGEPHGGNAWVRVKDFDALYRALLRDFPHHGAIAFGHAGNILKSIAYFLGFDVVAPLE